MTAQCSRSKADFAKAAPSELGSVRAQLTALRRFVGTNVIAATKIVKKHDKHVAESLRLKDQVAQLVTGLPFFYSSTLPDLCDAVEKAEIGGGSPKDGRSSPAPISVDEGGDDGKLVRLPEWLLEGAEVDAARAETVAPMKDFGGPSQGQMRRRGESLSGLSRTFFETTSPTGGDSSSARLKLKFFSTVHLPYSGFLLALFLCPLTPPPYLTQQRPPALRAGLGLRRTLTGADEGLGGGIAHWTKCS